MLGRQVMVIHGGGYVGLTGALHYAKSEEYWNKVIIYDPDPNVVAAINSGHPKVEHFLAYLNDITKDQVSRGRLRATTNFDEISHERYHTVAVPSERYGEPYDGIVLGVLRKLFKTCEEDSLIIVESTLTPGTIDKVLPEMELYIDLAVCPRRDWFADKDKNLSNLPRVVGGVNLRSTNHAHSVLRTVTGSHLIQRTDYQTAELCKALENALLHIPVMFAHQLAIALPDKNIREALELAGTHWRLPTYHIGFGTGGRCVPLGTKYLLNATEHAKGFDLLTIASAAVQAEYQIRGNVFHFLREYTATHKLYRVNILGAGYRPDFSDIGGSPGIDIAKELSHEFGKNTETLRQVILTDPLQDPFQLEKIADTPCSKYYQNADVVVLATCHSQWKDLPERFQHNPKMILDAHGDWKRYRRAFEQYGTDYRIVGEPNWNSI